MEKEQSGRGHRPGRESVACHAVRLRLPRATAPGEFLKVVEEPGAEGGWLTWEGLQALQDGGHSHLLLQGRVAEVLVVQEAEQPRELGEQLLQG